MNYPVKIIEKQWLTNNVMQLVLNRPDNYQYKIGQGIELKIESTDLKKNAAPFTLTNLEDDNYLELIIKIYPDHDGFTNSLSKLHIGDSLLISEAWDSYNYKGEGVFIAGGSGITPFIPMIRNLKSNLRNHKLIYANRSSDDIILKEELSDLLSLNFINILSQEKDSIYDFGMITKDYLKEKIQDFQQFFYLCGPNGFSEAIKLNLIALGADENKIQIGY